MTEKIAKPQLRFAGFDDTWEQRKLGDIVGIYDGVHQTPNYQNSGVMFLSVENIATLKSSKFISEEDFKRDYKVFPQENDILMTRIGDVGTTNVVTDNGLKAYYVSLALLKYKSTDPYFLSNAIQSDYVQKGLANRTLKTAIPMKINKDEIGKVSVMLPLSATEQQQIGTYFCNLDNLITLHQRKYDKLTNVKKSMLEKMFPKNGSNVPEIRFRGFSDAWEQRKLGELAVFNPKEDLPDVFEYVDLESVVGTEMLSHRTEEKATAPSRAQRLAHTGDLFYQTVRPYQKNNYLFEKPDKHYVFSTGYAQLRPFIDGYFLLSLVQNGQFVKTVLDNCTGTSYPAINANDLAEIEVFSPKDEQEHHQIGTYFRNLDNLITLHQRELEKLKNLKKACLEKMFV